MTPRDTSGVGRRVLAGVAVAVLAAVPAQAHVDYVTDEASGGGLEYVIEVLSVPINGGLFAVTGLLATVAVGGYVWRRPYVPDFVVLRRALAEYEAYVPWMLRLSLGLPLVGAGFAGYFFSPVVQTNFRIFQVGLGFLILLGLATRVLAAIGLGSYLLALAVDPRLLLAMEYVPGFLAIMLVGSGRPSADHLLARVAGTDGTLYSRIDPIHELSTRVVDAIEPARAYVPTILRVGLGASFIYLGFTQKLADPQPALAVVTKYNLTGLVPVDAGLWVVGAGLAEMAFGLALIAGFLTRATAAGAFVLFTLTLFGLPDDPVLAHITMFGIASAIFTLGSGPLAIDSRFDPRRVRQNRSAPA
jgi:uncharacterized membrane protein YphA (DoxX/SURF4 family)